MASSTPSRLRTGQVIRTASHEIYAGWVDGSRRRLDDKDPTTLASWERDISMFMGQLDELRKAIAVVRISKTPKAAPAPAEEAVAP